MRYTKCILVLKSEFGKIIMT